MTCSAYCIGHLWEGFTHHAKVGSSFGKLPDGQSSGHTGLGIVVSSTLVREHMEDAAEVFVIDTAIDKVQVRLLDCLIA